MRKNIFCLPAILVITLLVSCKKDGASPAASALVGNWKFVSIHAKTESIVQYEISPLTYKAITYSDYTTTDNKGTVTITESTFNGNGLTYKAAINALTYEYVDNNLLDSVSNPINVEIPPTNSTSTYQLVGQDSIHIVSGSLLAGDAASSNSGAKFSISGNILTLTMMVVKDSSYFYGSFPANLHESGNVDVTFQRQ